MFLNMDQENKFNELVVRDNTSQKDVERRALFYIFAGNEDLFNKVNSFYDFEDHSIDIDGFENVDLTGSARGLVELAFNLYNDYEHLEKPMQSIVYLFGGLDDKNFELALQAIKIRFNKA